MEGNTLTVASSEFGYIPEGTEVTVTQDQTNQFTGQRTLSIRWSKSVDVPNRTAAPSAQVIQMPEDDVWTEVHVGLSREHEKLTFEEDV